MKSCVNDWMKVVRFVLSKGLASWVVSALVLLVVSAGFTGCSSSGYSNPAAGTGFSGSVFGGQQPVTGSLIQLYAVGTTGDGSAATPLISATVTTSDGTGLVNSNANAGNANNTLAAGSFTITGDFTCPTGSTEVYLVSTGGNPGLVAGTKNTALTLMAALGPCGNLSPGTFVSVNELTTIGTLAPLFSFTTSYSSVGSAAGDASQLQADFTAVNQYTNTSNGTVPGPSLPSGYSAPSTAIQTLGDIVATCINSAGGVAGDSSACGQLFTLATISGNAAPTDTVGAILNILKQPTVNVTQIYALLPANNPFQPTLAGAPANWQLPITSNTATKLAFSAGPTTTASGSPISPAVTVTVEDASNTPQTSATNTVTLTIGANPSNATLSGTISVAAINGVATFSNLSIDKTGVGYTLTASSTGLAGTSSGTFNITLGPATKLVFGTVTSPVPAGTSITPAVTVSVEDAASNVVTTSSASIAMAIGTNPSSGTLSGTTPVSAINGVATFSNLSINNVGSGYTLSASSAGLTGAISGAFNITGAAINVTGTTVGNNLITTLSMSLPAAAPATEMMTLTSNDPTHFLLSTTAGAVGTTSVQVQLTSGSASIPGTIYLQGQNYSGTTAITGTITASAGGFSNGTGTMSLYPSGLAFTTSSFSTTTQSSATTLTVGLNLLSPGTLTFAGQGFLGPQAAAISYSVTSGTTSVGTLTGSPATWPQGYGNYYSQSISFHPAGAGSSVLTLNQPSGYYNSTTSSWPVQITATVTAPTINAPTNTIVGNNMINSFSIGLQTAPTATDTFTISTNDTTHFLLSLTAGGIGSASVSPTVGAGGSIPTIYLEGQNYSGTTAITANLTVTDSLGAYTSGSGTLSLYPSGFALSTNSFSTTTLASPTTLTVGFNMLTPGTLTFAGQGFLGPQASPVTYSVGSGTTSVGTIAGNPATWPQGYGNYYSQTISFHPAGAGSSVLTLNQPSGYYNSATPSWPVQITATVTAPTINVPSNSIVGNNLVTTISISLQSAPTSTDTFTVTSNDVNHFLLSLSPTTIGTNVLTIPVGSGGSIPTIYLEGLNYTGTTAITTTLTVTDSLNAYTPNGGTLTLYPSGLGFNNSSFSTTTFSSPTTMTVGLNLLTPGTLTFAGQGTLGPQATASPSFTITSGTTATGTITGNPGTFTVNGSTYSQNTSFQPVAAGTSVLTINEPTGYFASTSSNWPTQITATVNAPTITVNPTTVGNNFITTLSISLQSGPPTSETMTITSNDSTHFLLSTSPTVVGSASVQVTLTAGSASVPTVYLQGQNFNNNATAWTTSVTATAIGYTGGSGTQTLYPSGLGFNNSSFSVSKSGSPVTMTVGLNVLNPSTLTFFGQGTLGPQGASPTFTITSGTPATGTITGNPGTFTVNGSTYSQNTSFQPVAVGTTVLTINQPTGYISSTSSNWPSQITATVGP